jgi:hypothetical protein
MDCRTGPGGPRNRRMSVGAQSCCAHSDMIARRGAVLLRPFRPRGEGRDQPSPRLRHGRQDRAPTRRGGPNVRKSRVGAQSRCAHSDMIARRGAVLLRPCQIRGEGRDQFSPRLRHGRQDRAPAMSDRMGFSQPHAKAGRGREFL